MDDIPLLAAPAGAPIWFMDQLVRQRGIDADQTPIFAYPRTPHGTDDYEFFTGHHLDGLTTGAAAALAQRGLPPVWTLNILANGDTQTSNQKQEESTPVVGLLARSDVDYIATLFGLLRLGYAPFLVSPRLAPAAIATLLGRVRAIAVLHNTREPSIRASELLSKNQDQDQIRIIDMPTREECERLSRSFTSTETHPLSTYPPLPREYIPSVTSQHRVALLTHSSGSTGLPKPVPFTQRRLASTCLSTMGRPSLHTVPLSHSYGLVTLTQAVWSRKPLYVVNSRVPQTGETITRALRGALACERARRAERDGERGRERTKGRSRGRSQDFQQQQQQVGDGTTSSKDDREGLVVFTVPYVLGLVAEREDGVEVLKQAWIVCSSGSRTPEELGNRLTREGVRLGSVLGASETGTTLTSLTRPPDDDAWDYLRPPPHARPFMWFKPLDDDENEANGGVSAGYGKGVYEQVILDGWPGKMGSNSSDPPNSWHSSDLMVPHPSIPYAWKYVGRRDDRVTLLNGEKVLPLPIEGRVRSHPLVREAVVFGVDRAVPGLLLFRANGDDRAARGDLDDDDDDEAFLDAVWPTIEAANSTAEAFSQIARDMCVVLPAAAECPTTDKSSIKRGLVYKHYAEIIDEAYARAERGTRKRAGGVGGGTLAVLDEAALEQWILNTLAARGIHVTGGLGADLFSAGVDSLMAIQLRASILSQIDLGPRGAEKCTSMIVYDCGTARELARRLVRIREGRDEEEEEEGKESGGEKKEEETGIELMEHYIRTISDELCREELSVPLSSSADVSGASTPKHPVILLTGVTGFLGAHVLAKIVTTIPDARVYCLVRRPAKPTSGTDRSQSAEERVSSALALRELSTVPLTNVTCWFADLEQPSLGLENSNNDGERVIDTLRSEVTHIMHCAWPVNFALPLRSFEPAIRGVANLLRLAVSISTSTRSSPHRWRPCHFLFCSSVATALESSAVSSSNTTKNTNTAQQRVTVPSGPITSLAQAAKGYGQSKLVCERIIEQVIRAATSHAEAEVRATVFRIGQIVPGRAAGTRLWNPTEAIPLGMRSAVHPAIGALPRVPAWRDACRWIPADDLAAAMLELGDVTSPDGEDMNEDDGRKQQLRFFNLVNPRAFSWNRDLLPALRRNGGLGEFETPAWGEWVDKLAASPDDPVANPTKKLLRHYREMGQNAGRGEVFFDFAEAERCSSAVRGWGRVVDAEDMIPHMVEAWKSYWDKN